MSALAWTKFQDFYLRFGFLKVCVCMLSAERRSESQDAIIRRIDAALFEHAESVDEFEKVFDDWKIAGLFSSSDPKKIAKTTIAEALLIRDRCPSLLYAITPGTIYKILDWARDVGFLAQGNQISEAGLLLRALISDKASSAFLNGDYAAWNPFIILPKERLYLTYHLLQIDQLSIEIVKAASGLSSGDVLQSRNAGAITCRAFFSVLERYRNRVSPADAMKYRKATELACSMANEMAIPDLIAKCGGISRSNLPKPIKIPALTGDRRSAASKTRKSTKNTDHQTIPRFEQLTDLGFFYKPDEF